MLMYLSVNDSRLSETSGSRLQRQTLPPPRPRSANTKPFSISFPNLLIVYVAPLKQRLSSEVKMPVEMRIVRNNEGRCGCSSFWCWSGEESHRDENHSQTQLHDMGCFHSMSRTTVTANDARLNHDGLSSTFWRRIKASPTSMRRTRRSLTVMILLCLYHGSSCAFNMGQFFQRRRRLRQRVPCGLSIEIFHVGVTVPALMSPSDDNDLTRNAGSADPEDEGPSESLMNATIGKIEKRLLRRISKLEEIVARQEVELHRLKRTCSELSEVSQAFASLLQLLREAGLDANTISVEKDDSKGAAALNPEIVKNSSTDQISDSKKGNKIIESFDDNLIFGTAPSSVIDAADAAGAAILAAMLGGKQRMLVDVRDAELSSDPETLVQFIELAILPVAAGLEGLQSTRNRVKIVFPKVSQLLEYRRTMALAAPEVVALSTLGFDPVEERDKLVVIVAPTPDDEEGIQAMKELLSPNAEAGFQTIQQPVVVLNYHMVPFSGLDVDFETAYHLRLLAVQYLAGSDAEEYLEQFKDGKREKEGSVNDPQSIEAETAEMGIEDAALESAMKHAHDVGMNQGVTRAMVIRAYPRPWHVFIDLSPDTDADYEVAATFDQEPSIDQINFAIVECLEGSEREDEIVAQQMQQALEEGQLDKVSEMISNALGENDDENGMMNMYEEDDDFDMFDEDSV